MIRYENETYVKYVQAANIKLPETCPICHGDVLVKENGTVECANMDCVQKIAHKFQHFFTGMEIMGAGDAFVNVLSRSIKTVNEICKAAVEGNVEPFAVAANSEKNGEKVMKNIVKALEKSVSLERYFDLFDLDGFGEGRLVGMDTWPCFEGFYKAEDKVAAMSKYNSGSPITFGTDKCVSVSVRKQLKHQIDYKFADILESVKYFKFADPKGAVVSGGVLEGLSFCFTGKAEAIDGGRKACEALVVQNGGTISSVKKGLSYLVTDDTGSGSSKNVKAAALGIPVITSFQFRDMVTKT